MTFFNVCILPFSKMRRLTLCWVKRSKLLHKIVAKGLMQKAKETKELSKGIC